MQDGTIIKLTSIVITGGIVGALVVTGNGNMENIIPMLVTLFLPSPINTGGTTKEE